jgi:hypothetical protein
MPIDYKALLERYMAVVWEHEWSSFVHDWLVNEGFTQEEVSELLRIEKEVSEAAIKSLNDAGFTS